MPKPQIPTPSAGPSPASNAVRSLSPVIAMVASYGVRKALASGYEHRTGKPAPLVTSTRSSLAARVLWTASVAAAVALVEALVFDWLSRREQ